MPLSWDELEQIRGRKDWRIPVPPTCPRCNYILLGLPEQRCPECGHGFDWLLVRRRAGRIWSAVNTLRHANRDARVGLKIIGAGWGLWLLVALPVILRVGQVSLAACFLRVLIGCAALLGFVLCAQVLNVRRVPPWARRYIEGEPPRLWMGIAGVSLSLLLIVADVVIG
ncbi:MAG: hypothetical protein HRF43_18595 [Phycisphaerae bacterium]|jgi:hypothetical protein